MDRRRRGAGRPGRLVLVAIHTAPRIVDLHRFFWRELSLVGARLYRSGRLRGRPSSWSPRRRVPVAELVSAVEPLERVGAAFATLEAGDGVMKVLIDCRERPDDAEEATE